ncbi:MAG: T9SS type A sorting domain-containing protein [Bacteroidales bacterium]|nr:T9SS type A sorting domain-containing protein [Bacteroidales bacterium]
MKNNTSFVRLIGNIKWLLLSFVFSAISSKTNALSVELPFYEDFSSGGYEQNGWTPVTANWQVTWQDGNDYPCAVFNWNPVIYNGSATLTSPMLSATAIELGNIMFELDIKLTDRFETSTEHLFIEVSDGDNWVVLQEFTNLGSFDWQVLKYNITEFTMGLEFAIRFRAEGQYSGNIVGWFFDNIQIYRSCDPPENIIHNEISEGVKLIFNTPSSLLPIAEWMFYGYDNNFSGIGMTDGGGFSVAARWESESLAYYSNCSITKFRFFLQDDGFASIIAKIWKLDGSDTLLLSHLMPNPIPGEWNEVVLESPIPVDQWHELWAGYEIIGQPAGEFPAGTDAGPAVTGYGDLISLDGGLTWDALSEIAPTLSYNWNIQLFMDDFGYVQAPSGFRYNIYRSFDNGPYEFLDSVDHVVNQFEYVYIDDIYSPPFPQYYWCWEITAIWDNGTDFCESEPGKHEWYPGYDEICLMVIDIKESNSIPKIYPNPARDALHISHQEGIREVEVFTMLGNKVMKQSIDKLNEIVLNVSGLSSGVYHLRIHTSDGIIVSKVVVKHE